MRLLAYFAKARRRWIVETYGNTGEKTSFGYAEEDARGQKSAEVLYQAHERHDNSPRDHDCREPAAGAKLLEQQVAGHFKGRVPKEEDG